MYNCVYVSYTHSGEEKYRIAVVWEQKLEIILYEAQKGRKR